MADSTRKRRWFAFRLRTLLIVVTLLGCLLMPLVIKINRAREQKQAVSWVLKNGEVGYDWESPLGDATSPPGSKWLRRWLGDEFFQTVRSVDFANTQAEVRDLSPLKKLTELQDLSAWNEQISDLSPLQGLSNLRRLILHYTSVSDLSPLRGLIKLQQLDLNGTQVSDLSPLKGLTNLQQLKLSVTPVSDLSPLRELTSLRELDLDHTLVSDLSPLKGLAKLDYLDIRATKVTDEEVKRLQKALPNCEITR